MDPSGILGPPAEISSAKRNSGKPHRRWQSMLRRTVQRAFGTGADDGSTQESAPVEVRRRMAMEAFFTSLHEAMEHRVTQRKAVDPLSTTGLELTRPRPLSEGLEFRLEVPGASLRFVNGLEGFIHVESLEEGRPRRAEILSVQWQRGAYRPIHKTVSLGAGGSVRSPFRFTSVPELAQAYLREALSHSR
jgi:hypothetical protein